MLTELRNCENSCNVLQTHDTSAATRLQPAAVQLSSWLTSVHTNANRHKHKHTDKHTNTDKPTQEKVTRTEITAPLPPPPNECQFQ